MKRSLYALSLAVSLAYAAAPAFAGDTSTITQNGTGSAATITQVGNSGTNNASIEQGQPPNGGGNNEIATVSQTSVSGSEALVYQWGDTNQSYVTQNNASDVHVNNIQNWGNGNITYTNQSNMSNGHISVGQNGDSNFATINQHDGGNMTAYVNSDAYGQGGDYNYVNMDQSGYDVFAHVEQGPGTNNQAFITQIGYGGLNTANVTQAGSYSVASVTQIGSNFTATVNQNLTTPGTANTATIYQHF